MFIWLLLTIAIGLNGKTNIFQSSDLDLYKFNKTRSYIEPRFAAKISYNRLSFYIGRYLNNLLTGSDINYFFFGNHPREVPGNDNKMRVNYWLLPYFLIGIYEQIQARDKRTFLSYCLILFIASFFSIDELWWTLAPFIYLIILYPLRFIWRE